MVDEEFLTFVTTHPSEIAVGIFYTPFLSQEKALVGYKFARGWYIQTAR